MQAKRPALALQSQRSGDPEERGGRRGVAWVQGGQRGCRARGLCLYGVSPMSPFRHLEKRPEPTLLEVRVYSDYQ